MKSRLVLPGDYATEETVKRLTKAYEEACEKQNIMIKDVLKMKDECLERDSKIRRWCRLEIHNLHFYLASLAAVVLILVVVAAFLLAQALHLI